MRKKVLNDIQQGLTRYPLPFKGVNVRASLELDPCEETMEQSANYLYWCNERARQRATGSGPAWENSSSDRASVTEASSPWLFCILVLNREKATGVVSG